MWGRRTSAEECSRLGPRLGQEWGLPKELQESRVVGFLMGQKHHQEVLTEISRVLLSLERFHEGQSRHRGRTANPWHDHNKNRAGKLSKRAARSLSPKETSQQKQNSNTDSQANTLGIQEESQQRTAVESNGLRIDRHSNTVVANSLTFSFLRQSVT